MKRMIATLVSWDNSYFLTGGVCTSLSEVCELPQLKETISAMRDGFLDVRCVVLEYYTEGDSVEEDLQLLSELLTETINDDVVKIKRVRYLTVSKSHGESE